MSRRREESEAARRRQATFLLVGIAAPVLLAGVAGCGGPGAVSVSKAARARIVADADADGKIVLPKSRNPRRPAVGLNIARALQLKKQAE